jgi:hypothetical protein
MKSLEICILCKVKSSCILTSFHSVCLAVARKPHINAKYDLCQFILLIDNNMQINAWNNLVFISLITLWCQITKQMWAIAPFHLESNLNI